jgi:hypothetical protein
MNRLKFFTIFILVTTHYLEGKNANIEAHCYSFSLLPLDTSDGNTMYFTTYDGINTLPLGITSNILSSEAKPNYLGSSTYSSDYIVVDPQIGISYYGTLTVSMPTKDSNLNGILDFLEIDLGVNDYAVFQQADDWDYYGNLVNESDQVLISRASGSNIGTWTLVDDGETVIGEWQLATWSGDIEYNENKELSLNLSRKNAYGITEYASGSGAYEYSENQISLGVLTVSDSSGTITTQPANLVRSGNTYSGLISLDDGTLETPWSDFTDWKIFITDNNDEDSDGVPDLSDYIKRSVSQELNLNGWGWHSWPWVYSNSLQDWIYYYPSGVGKYSAWSNYHKTWLVYDYSTKKWIPSN